jgi:hypothetical protein
MVVAPIHYWLLVNCACYGSQQSEWEEGVLSGAKSMSCEYDDIEKEKPIAVKTDYRPHIRGLLGVKCTRYVSTQDIGSHHPRCNSGQQTPTHEAQNMYQTVTIPFCINGGRNK